MKDKLVCHLLILVLLMTAACATAPGGAKISSLKGRIICLDAGKGGTAKTDSFRVGPTGEREEWINLRVALLLQKMLEEKGATVLMTRTTDSAVSFDDRIDLAKNGNAEVFLSIHHNATADPTVNFPIIYFHGAASENVGSVMLGKHIAQALTSHLYQRATPVSLVSDHAIFPTAGAKVLRGTYGIPGVIAEASFFTNPEEEKSLKSQRHNQAEARAYLAALEALFSQPVPPVLAYKSKVLLPQFRAFQEAERMNEAARNWRQDFLAAEKLMAQKEDSAALRKAYELFTRSARSFPDSYLAAQSHRHRATLLALLGQLEAGLIEELRAREHYVPVE